MADRSKVSYGRLRYIVIGALTAVAASFPLAAVIALFFRFPFPFVGYQSGFDAMTMAPLAVFVYGLLGGFILLGVGGMVCGLWGYFRGTDTRLRLRLTIQSASAFSFLCLMVLALLDQFIGPW